MLVMKKSLRSAQCFHQTCLLATRPSSVCSKILAFARLIFMMLKLKRASVSVIQTDTTGSYRLSNGFDALIDVTVIFRLKTVAL